MSILLTCDYLELIYSWIDLLTTNTSICENIKVFKVKEKNSLIIRPSILAICCLSNVQAKHLANSLGKMKKELGGKRLLLS